MQPPQNPSRPRNFQRYAQGIPAIGWALLSQSIWLPLLVIDGHDRWQSRVHDLKPEVATLEDPTQSALAGSTPPGQRVPGASTRLASIDRGSDLAISQGVNRSLAIGTRSPQPNSQPGDRQAGSAPRRTSLPSPSATPVLRSRAPYHASSAIEGSAGSFPAPPSYSQLDSLARPLGLRVGNSPLALANRASAVSDSDPLAALPTTWREPMRQALRQLPASQGGSPSLHAARVIYVPSERISAPSTVPLAIQPDGSLDIFSRPADPVVIEELRNWSKRQPQAAKGMITPVVIHLSPIPRATTTAMASPPSSAATQLRASTSATGAATISPGAKPQPAAMAPPPPLPPLPAAKASPPSAASLEPTARPAPLSPTPSEPAVSAVAPVAASTPASSVASGPAPEPAAPVSPEPQVAISSNATAAP